MKLKFRAPRPMPIPTTTASRTTAENRRSTSGAVILRDGRKLAYAEYGDADGEPTFYFHGTPGSRLEGELLAESAARLNIRLIAIDRPGFGESDFLKRRRFVDWPDDVRQLADQLGIRRFFVVGLSGGGPHALACAHQLVERLRGVAVVSGAVPPEAALADNRRIRRIAFRIGRRLLPFTTRGTLWITSLALRYLPAWLMVRFPDPNVLARAPVRDAFRRDLVEGFKHGIDGAALEYNSFGWDWGFRLDEISTRVHIWHGERDRVVPLGVARYVAAVMPGAKATFVPDGGHLMIVDLAEQIFADLLRISLI